MGSCSLGPPLECSPVCHRACCHDQDPDCLCGTVAVSGDLAGRSSDEQRVHRIKEQEHTASSTGHNLSVGTDQDANHW